MRFHTVLLIAGIFVLGGCDKAPAPIFKEKAPDPVCQELDAAIDESIKYVALSLVKGNNQDKSAVQQTARYTEANNYLQVIRINLDLQSQHMCPIRKSVINPMMYEKEAFECWMATLGVGNKTGEVSKLCDPKNWKGTAK